MRLEVLALLRDWREPYGDRYFEVLAALDRYLTSAPPASGPSAGIPDQAARPGTLGSEARPRRPGRPRGTGTFASPEELLQKAGPAIRHISATRLRVTQERLADELRIDVRNLRRALRRFELDWAEVCGSH